MMTRPLSAVSL